MAGLDATLGRAHTYPSNPDPQSDSVYFAFWRITSSTFGVLGSRGDRGFSCASWAVGLCDRLAMDAGNALADYVDGDSICLCGCVWEPGLVDSKQNFTLVAACSDGLATRCGDRIFVREFLRRREGRSERGSLDALRSLVSYVRRHPLAYSGA